MYFNTIHTLLPNDSVIVFICTFKIESEIEIMQIHDSFYCCMSNQKFYILHTFIYMKLPQLEIF